MSNDIIIPTFDRETCDSLTIRLEKVEGVERCLAMTLRGQIDTYSSPFFQRSVMKAIEAGFIFPILVMDGVEYLSSKAVGALMQIQTAARIRGGDIVLVKMHPQTMAVLQLLNLEKYFRCTVSMDEAIVPIRSKKTPLTSPKENG